MQLDDLLSKATLATSPDHLTVYLNGSIDLDHDKASFRIYSRPENRRSYLLLKRADVAGEILSSRRRGDEAGFVASKVHRVPLKFGAEVQRISVSISKLGETRPASSSSRFAGVRDRRRDPSICCCDDSALSARDASAIPRGAAASTANIPATPTPAACERERAGRWLGRGNRWTGRSSFAG